MKTTLSTYNEILSDQVRIEQINLNRPKIYIYTDFGGGTNGDNPLADLQTSGEIASAAWKTTLHQELYLNDSAVPLSPAHAAITLGCTFPFEGKNAWAQTHTPIHSIVIHVVDPGVGNEMDGPNPHPRAIVLRKDGVVFIGPDNGSLTLACPEDSIAGIWEINTEKLNVLSGIDLLAGGTFHGRDLFCEVAFRLASSTTTFDAIGHPYSGLNLKNRISLDVCEAMVQSIPFTRIHTERVLWTKGRLNPNVFEQSFLLGIIQSSLYEDTQPIAIAGSKKLFVAIPDSLPAKQILIGIVNTITGNMFIGPNTGLGTSFFKDYEREKVSICQVSENLLKTILSENNNETVYTLLKQQPHFTKPVKEIPFLGDEECLIRDIKGRPKKLLARIWVDLYGNIKTTLLSTILNEAKECNAKVQVTLNGIEKPVLFANTFSQVPKEQLFVYNGSTGAIGPNPHRSKRYVEISANGVFGKFGIDFFEKEGKKPQSGQTIWFDFEYIEGKEEKWT